MSVHLTQDVFSYSVWMSSATHYWPLSNVDDGKVWGTTDGQAFGSINVISGVKNKSESALQFSKSGMYIDVSFEEDDCLTFPDTCPQKKLTLSFMAMFDKTAANWPNVPLLDSLGGNAQNSTGISVTVNQKQLWFVVSYVDLFWMISVPIQGDEVWRHYALTCSQRLIQVFVNGKPVGSRFVTIFVQQQLTNTVVRLVIVPLDQRKLFI